MNSLKGCFPKSCLAAYINLPGCKQTTSKLKNKYNDTSNFLIKPLTRGAYNSIHFLQLLCEPSHCWKSQTEPTPKTPIKKYIYIYIYIWGDLFIVEGGPYLLIGGRDYVCVQYYVLLCVYECICVCVRVCVCMCVCVGMSAYVRCMYATYVDGYLLRHSLRLSLVLPLLVPVSVRSKYVRLPNAFSVMSLCLQLPG